jgi:hypothetical protein
MTEVRRLQSAGITRRELTIFFAALMAALLVVGPLSLISLTHNTETPQREVVDGAHSDLVAPTSASFAVPSARTYLRRTTTCSTRSCVTNAFLRDLAIAITAVSLIAWRRYVAGRRECRTPSPHHPGSIFFLRGPPSCSSRYSSARTAGDRPMNTTREEPIHAIRHRIDARAALRACVVT